MLGSVYDRTIRIWARVFGRPAYRRFNNYLVNLGMSGLGVGNPDSRCNGERRVLHEWLRRCGPAPVVWDVGASEGNYTALVRQARPDARIYAFEPHPRTFARLAARWTGQGIQCLPFALGAKPGMQALWDYESTAQGSSHATFYPATVRRETGARLIPQEVEVRTVDEVATAVAVATIELLKLDVEGNELACLEGAAGMLAQGRIAAIQFEFNSMHLDARVHMSDFAERLPGFTLYRVLPHGLLRLDFKNTLLTNLYRMQNIFAIQERNETV
jgi:FkbM family methyltransferase